MAFEGILAQQDAKPARWRKVALGFSLVVHVAGLAVGLVYSIWRVDEMPMPAIQVLLTEAPPPPPPPPPPAGAKKSSAKPRPKPVASKTEIVQPHNEKVESKPQPKEEREDVGVPGGVVGGVEGGVLGGVVGNQAPPPEPKKAAPKMVSATVGHHQLAINPNSPPYCCVKVPRSLDQSGVNITARLRVCVSADGQVNQVQILSGAGAGIDSQIPTFVRRWRYRPYLIDGQASPFCYNFRYEMSVR